MKTHVACSLFIAGICCSSLLYSEEPKHADEALLVKLKHDDFDVRESARKALIARGDVVRALIEAELKKPNLDPDYKNQLRSIAHPYKHMDILAAIDKPMRIDLELKDRPASEALQKIHDVFGYGAVLSKGAERKPVTVSMKGRTFFEAIDGLCKSAGLGYDAKEIRRIEDLRDQGGKAALVGDGSIPLVLADRTTFVAAAAKGPVAVMLDGSRRIRNADLSRTIEVTFTTLAEPGLRFSSQTIGNLEMRNSDNRNDVVNGEFEGSSVRTISPLLEKTDGAICSTFYTRFNMSEKEWESATFKVFVKMTVPLEIQEAQYKDIGAIIGVAQTFNGGSFTVQELQNVAGKWQLSYRVTGGLCETRGTTGLPGHPDFRTGIFILDEKNALINSVGGHTSTELQRADFREKPAQVFIRKLEESAVREYEIEIPNVKLLAK